MDHHKKKDTSANQEGDPFTSFMFGKPRIKKEATTDEEVSTEEIRKNESLSTDDWLFGRNRRSPKKPEAEEDNQINQLINNFLTQIDTEEVMKNVDLFIETTKEFKPLWKKIYPHIQKWVK
jgi:hypothetical protein